MGVHAVEQFGMSRNRPSVIEARAAAMQRTARELIQMVVSIDTADETFRRSLRSGTPGTSDIRPDTAAVTGAVLPASRGIDGAPSLRGPCPPTRACAFVFR